MRAHAVQVRVDSDDLLDTAGTGGGRRTFNVSTTAALIAAGAGCTVAKHGNRSATGLSGSADVLEALGARIDLTPASVARCIDEVGFGFMFAPAHHQATRYVIPVRRELAVRTIFNFLGPLTNPAGATRQLVGVSDPAYLETMAGALARLGTRARAAGQRRGRRRRAQHLGPDARGRGCSTASCRTYTVTPEEVGLQRARAADDVPGGDPQQNADTARRIFAGERGAARDLAVLNAGRRDLRRRPGRLARGGRAGRRAGDRRGRRHRRARAVRDQHPAAWRRQ